jgi:hypothetical protein
MSPARRWFSVRWSRLPLSQRRFLAAGGSFATGLLVAAMLHYVLFRFSVPSKPFIYVAF